MKNIFKRKNIGTYLLVISMLIFTSCGTIQSTMKVLSIKTFEKLLDVKLEDSLYIEKRVKIEKVCKYLNGICIEMTYNGEVLYNNDNVIFTFKYTTSDSIYSNVKVYYKDKRKFPILVVKPLLIIDTVKRDNIILEKSMYKYIKR